jgi:hypothetical protein
VLVGLLTDVFHPGIRTGIHHALVAVVAADKVRRSAVRPSSFEDDRRVFAYPDGVPLEVETVTYVGSHNSSLSGLHYLLPVCPSTGTARKGPE